MYFYDVQHSKWCVFPPPLSLHNINVCTKSVYLLHLPGHYDTVYDHEEG